MPDLFKKLVEVLTDPIQLVLLAWLGYIIKELWTKQQIIDKLLKVQEERGIVLTKITVMLEAMFNDSRRPK